MLQPFDDVIAASLKRKIHCGADQRNLDAVLAQAPRAHKTSTLVQATLAAIFSLSPQVVERAFANTHVYPFDGEQLKQRARLMAPTPQTVRENKMALQVSLKASEIALGVTQKAVERTMTRRENSFIVKSDSQLSTRKMYTANELMAHEIAVSALSGYAAEQKQRKTVCASSGCGKIYRSGSKWLVCACKKFLLCGKHGAKTITGRVQHYNHTLAECTCASELKLLEPAVYSPAAAAAGRVQ